MVKNISLLETFLFKISIINFWNQEKRDTTLMFTVFNETCRNLTSCNNRESNNFLKIISLCISLLVFIAFPRAPILDQRHCLNNLESTLSKDVWEKKSEIVWLKLFFPPLYCPTIPLRLMIWTNWIYLTLRCFSGKRNIFKDSFFISSCKYRSTQCGSTLTTGIIILTSVYLHYPLHLHKLKLL